MAQRPPPPAAAIQQALAQARALHQRGQAGDAAALYDRILRDAPRHADALQLRGVLALQGGDAKGALRFLDRAVAAEPRHPAAQMCRGHALIELDRPGEALAAFDRALALLPDSPEAHAGRGTALVHLGRAEEALAAYDRAIALRPDSAASHCHRGSALAALKRQEEAVAAFDRAIALRPDYAAAHSNRGNALKELGRDAESLAAFDRALEANPVYALGWLNKGAALAALFRKREALACYARALSIDPDLADAHVNKGRALVDLGLVAEAIPAFRRAAALEPEGVEPLTELGEALRHEGDLEGARRCFDRALARAPEASFLPGLAINIRLRMCDWDGLAPRIAALEEAVLAGRLAAGNFEMLSISARDEVLLRAARRATEGRPVVPAPAFAAPREGRIRLGYVSADFYDHAVAVLVAEMLERHDRTRFDLHAYAIGPDRQDAMRARIERNFPVLVDARGLSDEEAAARMRADGIDIAIDLTGYTAWNRAGIFARRAAPVQVNWLGYPGTLGAASHDYILADPTVIPPGREEFYAEKVARLPHMYQPNDTTRPLPAAPPARAALGLPEHGFVFCSFNNSYKVLPETFRCWMRLLRRVEESVLWLLEDNRWATANLRKEAMKAGVDPARLVFAPRVAKAEHLARHGAADLFLDTLPYNAHTTASDALWAGLPVLTLIGATFPGRVAASLLRAAGLPDLVTETEQDYEAAAHAIATEPGRLAAIRARIAAARGTAPLFDMAAFTRHVEAAFEAMHARRLAGLPPDHIAVAP